MFHQSTSSNPKLVAKPVEKQHGGKLKRWTDDDANILIDMMEEGPCLWDVNNKDYKSRAKKNEALNEIEDAIGILPR